MNTPTLLPSPPSLRVEQITATTDTIRLTVSTIAPSACCPLCGKASERVHSHYRRTLTDLPWNRVAVCIYLLSRKFFCDNPDCKRAIFTEPIPELAARYARKTRRLEEALYLLGYALGGEAGARVAVGLGLLVSPDTLLRCVRQVAASSSVESASVRVLGVDDWAFRRGQRYGTILVDLERRCLVDLLPDRSAQTLAEWLKAHPGVEIVSRDRASAYADAARTGAPKAQQVADRWHLLKSLVEALERLLSRHHRHLREAAKRAAAVSTIGEDETAADPASLQSETRGQQQSRHRRERRKQRYEQVVEWHRQGVSINQIARLLKMHRRTVRRFVRAESFPERAPPRRHSTQQDRFVGYLKQRWKEGCHNAAQLWRELREQGFAGSSSALRQFLARWRPSLPEELRRTRGKKPAIRPFAPPSPRQTAWLLLKEAEGPDEEKRQGAEGFVQTLLQQCPEIQQAQRLARAFLQMVRERSAASLDEWMNEVVASSLTELKSLVHGIENDKEAVRMALSSDWSNGQTEGQVHRLKMIKRQMYGRAKFDLLRARVLPMAKAA